MVFSSYRFIFAFFPVVFAVFAVLRALKKPILVKIWLALASLAFYALGQPEFFAVFLGSVLFNYLLAFVISKNGEKKALGTALMLVSVAENIGLLVYFKYTNFIIQNINRVFGSGISPLKLILPIGISFFTFQILAFTVSVWKKETKCPSLLDYMLFITFFPQLIVGPVVLHDELVPQIEGDRLLSFDKGDIMRGILLFSIGAAKKVILANPMINYATAFYTGDIAAFSQSETWLGVISFTFAYYFDFSGYIDMARGLGMLFGVRLPINFDSPYKATDFADFWRRWNMTVSRFFDRTIFNNVFHFGDGIFKMMLAVMATFLVSGIWHGAAWHFVIWGAVNGILVIIANLISLYGVKIPRAVGACVTFVTMMLVRVLFDAERMTDALLVYRKLFTGFDISSLALTLKSNVPLVSVICLSALICFFTKNSNDICGGADKSDRPEMKLRHIILAAALLVLSLVNMSSVSTFLYFSF